MTLTGSILILLAGYGGGFLLGSYLLRRILRFVDPGLRDTVSPRIDFHDVGTWIGLCEHFLIVTFVLADEYTAIALIFAAKELVRADKIREQPSYYLLGTLLSVAFAVLFGVLTRLALERAGTL
ncbi:MAG: hypothetical protein ACE5HK_01955 [Candidatus Methylomirabilales bacterium]